METHNFFGQLDVVPEIARASKLVQNIDYVLLLGEKLLSHLIATLLKLLLSRELGDLSDLGSLCTTFLR